PLTLRLGYALDHAVEFEETFAFEGGSLPPDPSARHALERAIDQLHLMAGISYFKAALPPEIVVENRPVDPDTAALMEYVWLHGLAEFAHRNRLDLEGRIRFPAGARAAPPGAVALARHTAVPIGGGKDSIVTLEILRAAGEPITPIAVGDFGPIADTL